MEKCCLQNKALQRLIYCFTHASREFGLDNLNKTNITGQDVNSAPTMSISDHTGELEIVLQCVVHNSQLIFRFCSCPKYCHTHSTGSVTLEHVFVQAKYNYITITLCNHNRNVQLQHFTSLFMQSQLRYNKIKRCKQIYKTLLHLENNAPLTRQDDLNSNKLPTDNCVK